MPPMIITRSAGRPAVASRGGGPGRRAGSGDSRTRGHSGDQGNGRDDGSGSQVGSQGSEVNGIGKASHWLDSKIRTRGREAAIGMSWEDFKTLTREEFCPSNEMQKLETEMWNHAMVRVAYVCVYDSFWLARLVPQLVIPECRRLKVGVWPLLYKIREWYAAKEPKTSKRFFVQLVGTLTDEP
ncbi:hypothetical protein Tco_0241063 [Tanacetum coccineum]